LNSPVCAIAISLRRRSVCSGCRRVQKYPEERGAQYGRALGAPSRKQWHRHGEPHSANRFGAVARTAGRSHSSCRVAHDPRRLSSLLPQRRDLFCEKILVQASPGTKTRYVERAIMTNRLLLDAIDHVVLRTRPRRFPLAGSMVLRLDTLLRPCHAGGSLPSVTYSRTIRDDQNQL